MSTVQEQYTNVQQEIVDMNKDYVGVKPKGPGLTKNNDVTRNNGNIFYENKEQDGFNGENDGYKGSDEEKNDGYNGDEEKENEEDVGPVCVDVNNKNEGNGDVEENCMGSFMDEDFFDNDQDYDRSYNDGFVGPVYKRNFFCPKGSSKFMKISMQNESVKTTCSYNWIKQEIENCCDQRVKKLKSEHYEFIRNKDCRVVFTDNKKKVGICRFLFGEQMVDVWLPYSVLVEKPFVRVQRVSV